MPKLTFGLFCFIVGAVTLANFISCCAAFMALVVLGVLAGAGV